MDEKKEQPLIEKGRYRLMKKYQAQSFEGERPLFGEQNATIMNTTLGEGESPLKETRNIVLKNSIFKWKYPLWYSKHVSIDRTILETVAHAGIWYTDDIKMTNCSIQASKTFRRSSHIILNDVHLSNAAETLWACDHVKLDRVQANGQYFGMNSQNMFINHLDLIGNYCFDGAKNVEVHNSTLVSKDAFWNCENVTVYDSVINGEYLGWNTKNLTLVNCIIESDQGLCYIDHLTMRHCKLLETDLAFEYCTDIDAEIDSRIMSVKNPISGQIQAQGINELIMDPTKIDPSKTTITTDTKIIKKKSA
jgi:hypothetical protein